MLCTIARYIIIKDNLLVIFTNSDDGNLAYHVTEDYVSVDIARNKLAKKYNFDNTKLQYMEQIHSNIVKTVTSDTNINTCDALITNKKNTPLMVIVADCIPMLFHDNKKQIIGVAHAGRKGTLENIVKNTIFKMKESYSCDAQDIEVRLGPSIQKCCYEVSKELALQVENKFGEKFVINRNLDLQGINRKQLLECGVVLNNITISKVCTKCSNEPYFSYRKDKNCGRFAGLIMMKSKK